MNSYGSSSVKNIYWGHHFKRLHEEGNIANNTLKIANKSSPLPSSSSYSSAWKYNFPYFDFDNMKFAKYRIKGVRRTKTDKIEVKM